MQKGFAVPLLLVGILLIVGLVSALLLFGKTSKSEEDTSSVGQKVSPKKEISKLYTNQNLGFEFQYPDENLIVKDDTEEEFSKRGNGDFRKNFKGYVGYEPGKFLGAVVVLEKEGNYDTNPFTVWLFDNPDELSIDKWHHDFWYYPFVWGDFTSLGKYELAPDQEATISGQMGKSRIIDYQLGKPKFIYVAKDKKMYLFRIIGEKSEQILPTFKFLQ